MAVHGAIRSAVAYLVGMLAAWLLTQFDVAIDDQTNAALVNTITLSVATVYYLIVRAMAKKWPWIEWFLGSPVSPVMVRHKNQERAKKITQSLR